MEIRRPSCDQQHRAARSGEGVSRKLRLSGLLVLAYLLSVSLAAAQSLDLPEPGIPPLAAPQSPPSVGTAKAATAVPSGPQGPPIVTEMGPEEPYQPIPSGPSAPGLMQQPPPAHGLIQPPGLPPIPGLAPAPGTPGLPELPGPRNLMNLLPGPGGPPGSCPLPPVPDAQTVARYRHFVNELIEPEMPLDLIVGRTRLMIFKQAPKRVQIADDSIAAYTILEPLQISLLGKTVGTTVLTMWFAHPADPTKQEILTYMVRVCPDPDAKARLQRVYDALADEINCLFKDSNICLKLVGDKIVVSGHAHDVNEASAILKIVRANAPNPNPRTRRTSQPTTAQIPVDQARAGVPQGLAGTGAMGLGLDQYELLGGEYVINMIRIPGEQQVMLRVSVAEVNRAAARAIGLNFSLLNNNGSAFTANNTGLITTGGIAPSYRGGGNGMGFGLFGMAPMAFGIPPIPGIPIGSGGFNNLPTALDNGQIRLAVSALRNLNYAKSLAEPNLVTLNGQTATFRAGGQFPVPIVSGFTYGGLQGVNFVPYGVQLSFTPFITDRDRVRLVLAAEVSSRDLAAGNTFIGGAAVPSLIARTFQTTVELREGQTLAVAGLIQNNVGAQSNHIPFFGDIPVLANLLGFSRITAGEQELVVLITPELVHPMEPKEVPPLPGADLFEPTDIEFYLLGRIESHFPVDYRSPVRTDWQRLHQYRTMENMYLPMEHGHAPVP